MRTTLTLDPDVTEAIKARVAASKATFKDVVNDTLRQGLAAKSKTIEDKEFRVTPFSLGLRPGIDPYKLNQLADELETQEFVKKMRKLRKRPR